ncbi:MAG: hypothetical protein ACYDFU_06435, partial [Nitrospirota bacterium]
MKKYLSATVFALIILSVSASGWCQSPVLWQDPNTGQVFTKPGEGRVPIDLSTLTTVPQGTSAQAAPAAQPGDYSSQAFKDAVTNAVGEKEAKTFPKIKIGGLMYGEYYYNLDKENPISDNGHKDARNAFALNRGYLNVFADLTPQIGVRITSDLNRVSAPGDNNNGDLAYRLKYYYVDFHKFLPGYSGMEVKMGQFQTPWLDYEEGIWEFRVVDNMLIEKEGFINAGDLGVDFRGPLPKGYGSWQVSVDNGEGYHSDEVNKYKAVEARLTLQPIPQIDALKQLQFSGYVKYSRNNFVQKNDRYIALAGYKYHDDAFVAGEYDWTIGKDGVGLNPNGNTKGHGYSLMAWYRMPFWKPIRIIGRFDQFRHDEHAAHTTDTRWIYGVAYDVNKNVMFVLNNDRTVTGAALKAVGDHDNNLAKL